MIPIQDSDPVLVGNRVESVIPYLMSDEFVVDAKSDGKVVEVTKDYCVVQYSDGTKFAIDITTRLKKNASQGTWTDNTLHCELKLGDTFKKGDILAYNDKHFSPTRGDRGVSLNLGAMAKIAISSQWDVFEDSAPISKKLSNKLRTEVVDEKHVSISKYAFIDHMVKIGDQVKAGDTLLRFSDSDEFTADLVAALRAEGKEDIIESAKTTITTKYTGRVADIKIYTKIPTSELSDSLRPIVESYQKKVTRKNKTLNKHKNPGDLDYYKAGQVISETDEAVATAASGKLKGYIMGESDDVLILIYIQYELSASKGDKIVMSVCKGVISHVVEEGMEAYSEYRPDEVIDSCVAPLAVAARKVPAIFLSIFTNKLIIELKHQLKDIYDE